MKCPICDAELQGERVKMDNILCEETYSCGTGHYMYQYTTGYIFEFVNGKEFMTYAYNSQDYSPIRMIAYKLDIALCDLYKNWLRKKLKKLDKIK